jgi:hypothetical protein
MYAGTLARTILRANVDGTVRKVDGREEGRILCVKSSLCCTACDHVKLVLTSLLFVVVLAPAVELFRYRYHAEDGREFECVFETDEQSVPKTVGEEKAAEIAADWVTSFYHVQVGAIQTQEFRTRPIAHWLFCFSDTIKGPIETNVFRRSPAQRDGCSTESGGAAEGRSKLQSRGRRR